MRVIMVRHCCCSAADVSAEVLPASTAQQAALDDIDTNTGYNIVRHPGIVTNDDYVLEAWRVEADAASLGTPIDGPPVVLAHGLGGDGTTWFSNGAESIAF